MEGLETFLGRFSSLPRVSYSVFFSEKTENIRIALNYMATNLHFVALGEKDCPLHGHYKGYYEEGTAQTDEVLICNVLVYEQKSSFGRRCMEFLGFPVSRYTYAFVWIRDANISLGYAAETIVRECNYAGLIELAERLYGEHK
jgi:hypothetical protein